MRPDVAAPARPQLHEVVLEFGIEYFDSALMPLDNFISRGTDHFLSCKSPDYLASVNEVRTPGCHISRLRLESPMH